MDTNHTNDPGEEPLDLTLERSSVGDPDLELLDPPPIIDDSAPIFGGLEPASHSEPDLLLADQEVEAGLFPAFDGASEGGDDSSAPLTDGLLELTDDVWGPDGGETADLSPGPPLEEWIDGLAIEEPPADRNVEPAFALPAAFEPPSGGQTARLGAGNVWAGMAPSRRYAIGIAGSALSVILVFAAWSQRPDVAEDVISSGTLQTTTSVAARRSPPAPTSTSTAPAADAPSTAATPDTAVAPVTNSVRPDSPAPSVSGGPASPRTGAGAPATTAPERASTTPATRVAATEAPATTAPPATAPPPVTPDTTETTRRFREPPTTVMPEPPIPTTVASAVPCSEYIKRGPLACPPAE